MAATSEVEVHFKPVIDAPTVRPGDKLLIRVDPRSTRKDVDELLAALKDRLPGVEVCVIAAEQIVVYRPEDEANLGRFSKPEADRG